MKDNKKNIHDGHRGRLLDTMYRNGLEYMSDIQVMEFILTYVLTRKDVNPVAHDLLDRYGNIPTVLDAPVEDLVMVDGIGKTSAKKLHMLPEIFYYYSHVKASKKTKLGTVGEVYDYVEALLRFKNVEELHILAVNAKGEVVGERCMGRGTINAVGLDMKDVSLFVNTYHAPTAIIVHNHPGGYCCPSEQDIVAYNSMANVFTFSGCQLYDSLILGSDGIYSMKEKRVKRAFIDDEELYLKMVENQE